MLTTMRSDFVTSLLFFFVDDVLFRTLNRISLKYFSSTEKLFLEQSQELKATLHMKAEADFFKRRFVNWSSKQQF